MKNLLFYIITLWLLLWTQILTHQLSGGSFFGIPWVLTAVLFFGLARGPLVGQAFGGTIGLLLDASALGLFGLHALLFALIGYSAGMLRRQVDGVKPWTQMILVGVTSTIFVCSFIGLDHLFSRSPRPVQWTLVLQPLVQALVAPAVFFLLRRWVEFWDVFRLEEA